MGLFSRKKRRDQEPQQSFVGPVHSQQPVQRSSVASHASQPTVSASSAMSSAGGGAPSTPSSRFHNPFSSAASSKQQSPPPPTPIAKSPYREYREGGPSEWNDRASLDVAPSSAEWNVQPERVRIMSEAATANRGSILSLPPAGRPSLDVNQRQRQMSAGGPSQTEDEQAKRSRWKIGRSAPKPRQNSSGSVFDNQGQGRDAEESSGFVVKSFRTVSRVHEDPIPQRSTTTAADQESLPPPPPPPPAPVLPTTSQFSRPSVDSQRRDLPQQLQQHQVESLRPSIELESETASRGAQPRRPSLATLGMGRPSSQSFGGDRDGGSGTIPAEAFRVASARSAISLASLDGANSPPLESSRPRFEPQRPQSRTSRRGSNYSDAGSSILIPPRPSFAIGRHSNNSGSSIDSRSSSTSNGASGSPATPASTLPYDAPSPSSPPLGQSRLSFSSSSQALSPSGSATGAIAPTRPAAQRMSSGDSELRLIAAYGDMISSSPPKNDDTPLFAEPSPVSTTANRSRASFSAESPQRPRSIVTNNTPQRASMCERAPNFSVQPPTPQSRTEEPFNRPKRTSSLQPDSVGKALQAMAVGRAAAAKSGPTANQKGKAVATRGWTSDSSDEELECLSTSDEESDDEVPLAAIQSRSQTDLTLTAAGLRSRTSFETTRAARVDAGEVEVLADRTSRKPPFATAQQQQQQQQKRVSQASLGVSPLARRGSNRRSMSTLSFSTSMTISQAAASSNASTPTLPPSAQRVPYQNRSVSNPSAPTLPSFAATSSTAPSSATETTASSALPSPLLQSSASRDRSSASSGSATTTSSFPHTPKDRSPAVSTLGLETRSAYGPAPASGHGSKPSVKFDLATAMSTIGEPRSQRLSMLGAASQSTPNLLPDGSALGLAPPVPSPFASPRYPRESGSAAGAPTSQEASTTTIGTMNERSKARHRAEALKAIQIGRELNDPSGLVPDHEAQEALSGGDGSDENEPLANLPSRGSMLGGMGRGPAAPGSMMSGFGGAPGGLPGVGVGGQYSHLAIPPPGVDPYLYASLPPDQKMSLHQRSQQMMAMMQEAAVRAKAESVMGGGGGAGGSTIGGHGGGRPSGHGQSMSMGSYDAFAAASMGMPYGYPPQQQLHHPLAMMQHHQQHMPPFAPPFAMSQHFFQPQYQHPQHFYGMPAYAGSAIGFSGGSAAGGTRQAAPSAIGIPSKASGMSAAARRSGIPQGRATSAIGTGYRA